MMKITPKIATLLQDLTATENANNIESLGTDARQLRGKLLQLYRRTNSDKSRETIIAIMTEAGYPWFANLARNSSPSLTMNSLAATQPRNTLLSEEAFLDLLPINNYFH